MLIPFRILSGVHRWRRIAARGSIVALASIWLVHPASSWGRGEDPSLRDRSAVVARQVLAIVGHRLVAPVRLEIVNDSSDAILGGFTEALTAAGLEVRLDPLAVQAGSVWTVRRAAAADDGREGLDVRVEQWPERSVIYSRLWKAGEDEDPEADTLLERVVVPITVGAAAALIVYLFFTVRS